MLHKIDEFPGKMTFFINFEKCLMQKYALLIFFAEYYGFPETEIFFFWKFDFCPFQWGIALYGAVNNNRDIFF